MSTTQGGFTTLSGAEEIVRHRVYTAPAAPSATATKAATALTASPQVGITAGITQPDVPRNLTIKGNASGNAGNVVLHGANEDGGAITETIALSGTAEVVGNKAFTTLISVDLPAETHAGTDTVSIGRGSKLGLGFKLSINTVLFAFLNKVREAVAPTVAVSASAEESNTVLLDSAIPGAQDIEVFYVEP